MLAALGRQMDVDVLISGGTHRYVGCYHTGPVLNPASRHSSSRDGSLSTLVRLLVHGADFGTG